MLVSRGSWPFICANCTLHGCVHCILTQNVPILWYNNKALQEAQSITPHCLLYIHVHSLPPPPHVIVLKISNLYMLFSSEPLWYYFSDLPCSGAARRITRTSAAPLDFSMVLQPEYIYLLLVKRSVTSQGLECTCPDVRHRFKITSACHNNWGVRGWALVILKAGSPSFRLPRIDCGTMHFIPILNGRWVHANS